MDSSLLSHVIEDTFKHAIPTGTWDAQNTKAFLVRFRLPTPDTHEGYTDFEVVLYAPMNYVQVWSRTTWHTIPADGLTYDDEGDGSVKEGFSYVKGASPWVKHADHDSCWRDGLRELLWKNESAIRGFSAGCGRWFTIVEVSTLELPPRSP